MRAAVVYGMGIGLIFGMLCTAYADTFRTHRGLFISATTMRYQYGF